MVENIISWSGDYLPGSEGKFCDPYVFLSEQDERIEEMRGLRTYKLVNQLRGRCFIKLRDGTELQGTWREGRREGSGMATTPGLEKLGAMAVAGNYQNGVLQGLGRVHMLDGSVWDGWFLNGKLHGPVRGYCKVRHVPILYPEFMYLKGGREGRQGSPPN